MPETIRLIMTGFSHVGAVREHNEDAIAVADWITGKSMAEPKTIELGLEAPTFCLVADGMGGHAAGEVASRTVAEHLARRAAEATDEAALIALLRDANAELFAAMEGWADWQGMGTTVAGIRVAHDGVMIFNVGDSRVYRIEGDRLIQLSTDDTPGPKLPDGRTAAYTTSVISQVLGGYDEEEMTPHVLSEPLAAGARYLICSDGLTDLVAPDEIAARIASDDRASIQALFEAAMERGGRDNVSIILVRLSADT